VVAGFSNPSSGPLVTTEVLPIAPVAEAGDSRVPIDPVLLTECQSQLSCHSPSVVYHSLFSQACWRQGPTPLLLSQNPLTGDQSKGIDIHTSTLDLDSGDDSDGDNSKHDGVDGFEANFDGSNFNDKGESVLPSRSKAHVHNSFSINAQDQDPDDSYDHHNFYDNAKNPDNGEFDDNGYQDIGAEYSTHHDIHDPTSSVFCFL